MKLAQQEKALPVCGANCQGRERECAVWEQACAGGQVRMQAYQVFPGIRLVYDQVQAQSCTLPSCTGGTIFEIRHCREGRVEDSGEDGFCSMEPGDLSVSRTKNSPRTFYYPLQHYHGITVVVDVEKTPHCLSCFLEDVNVQPGLLMEKFCAGPAAFVARSQPAVEHIFSELYSVPEEIKKGYLKVKVLELLLFLSCMDPAADERTQRGYSRSQQLLARSVCQYLSDHMDAKVTLEQLAEAFHVSGTQIKTSIKAVYGTSLYSFVRIGKMKSAAKMLRETNLTILEVAGKHGYDNASKFAGAFKSVMGMTPKEYRNAL